MLQKDLKSQSWCQLHISTLQCITSNLPWEQNAKWFHVSWTFEQYLAMVFIEELPNKG
jgi:hypothetical protein